MVELKIRFTLDKSKQIEEVIKIDPDLGVLEAELLNVEVKKKNVGVDTETEAFQKKGGNKFKPKEIKKITIRDNGDNYSLALY